MATLVLALWPVPALAGVYDLSEAPLGPAAIAEPAPLPSGRFQDLLAGLLRAQIADPETAEHARYSKEAREIEARNHAGGASVQDLANLGACELRLGRPAEAIEVLTRAATRDRRNFTVLGNLGTAYQLAGQPVAALGRLAEARDVWPRECSGLTPIQLNWYRKVEGYQDRLIRLRARESAAGRPADAPDDLFGVRFLSEGGTYRAGDLAPSERRKLPPDAVAVVQQLLIWLPADTRLYWLLGELLNAQGDISAAAEALDECLWARRFDSATLREHRRILREAVASAPPAPPTTSPEPAAPELPPGWHFNRGLAVGVGAGAGLLVGLLVYLQVREVRQRRARRQAPGRG